MTHRTGRGRSPASRPGVASLVIALAINNGFRKDLQDPVRSHEARAALSMKWALNLAP
jgi:hypothetical protein